MYSSGDGPVGSRMAVASARFSTLVGKNSHLKGSCGLALVTVLALLLSLAACGSSPSASIEQSSGRDVVNVGVLPSVGLAPLFLGIEQGFFKDAGLEVVTQSAPGGAALVPAVTSGELDVAFSNVVSIMLARQRGIDIQVVANGPLAVLPGGTLPASFTYDALLVPQNSSINEASDLDGKTIAINTLQNIEEIAVRHTLDNNGGDASTVNLVELPHDQVPAALSSGRVDAAMAVDPYVTVALQQDARILYHPFEEVDPQGSFSMYFSSSQFITDHPDVMERFTSALNRSLLYAEEHRTQARNIVASYTELPPDLLNQITMPHWSPTADASSLNEMARLAANYGVLPRQPNIASLMERVPMEE